LGCHLDNVLLLPLVHDLLGHVEEAAERRRIDVDVPVQVSEVAQQVEEPKTIKSCILLLHILLLYILLLHIVHRLKLLNNFLKHDLTQGSQTRGTRVA